MTTQASSRCRRLFGVTALVILISAAVIAVGWFALWTLGSIIGPPSDITDISRYGEARSRFGQCARRFPDSVPANATDVEMVWFQGFMQGSPYFELKYRVLPEEAAALAASFPQQQSLGAIKTDWIRSIPVKLLHSKHTGVPDLGRLADRGDDVFVFHSAGDWNHPRVGAVVIDRLGGIVVFVAEGG